MQGCFVTDEEIEDVIAFIKSDASAEYDEEIVSEIGRASCRERV